MKGVKKFSDLSLPELSEQVMMCHEHFRRCLSALRGDSNVEPVELFCDDSLGDSDDLELFYACKQAGAILLKEGNNV